MRHVAVARKTTPRVKDGRVQRKNHRDVVRPDPGPMHIQVVVPGPGYGHVLTEQDVRRFIALLPDWEDLSVGLEQIVLADGDAGVDGWYEDGSVHVCAWPDPLAIEMSALYYEAHREVLEQLRIPVGRPGFRHFGPCSELPSEITEGTRADGRTIGLEQDHRGRLVETCELVHTPEGTHIYDRVYPCRFTAGRVRAFQLLHILLHELGHHRDSQRAPARGQCVRGEEYAEEYALRHGRLIFERYCAEFGL